MYVTDGDKARLAIDAILARTGWSAARLGKELGWPPATIHKILDKTSKNPRIHTREAIEEMLIKTRKGNESNN